MLVKLQDEQLALFANDTFYLAFAQRDIGVMERLWAQRHPTLCIHPGWPAMTERKQIVRSWRRILNNPEQPGIDFYNVSASVIGSVVMVYCYEELPGSICVATNGFVKEQGEMRLFHHHSGPCANPPPPISARVTEDS